MQPKNNAGVSGFYEGRVDEIRIWSAARSSQEINSTMNQTLSGTETGLAGLWKLDGNADDSTANGANGNLSGGVGFESQTNINIASGATYRALLLGQDVDSTDLSHAAGTAPVNGSLTIDGPEFVYANNGTSGADSFSVNIGDGVLTTTETIDFNVV